MASIADILIAKGNAAAAGTQQRGNIYADLIRNLSSVPGQVVQQQRQREQDQIRQQIQQQQIGLQGQQLQLGQGKLAEAQQQQQDRAILRTILNDPDVIDPNTGRPNQAALMKRARDVGRLDLVGQISDLTDHLTQSADAAETRADANRRRDLEDLGITGRKLEAGGYDPGSFQTAVTFYANPKRPGGALIPEAEANRLLQIEDPAQIAQVVKSWLAGTTAGKPNIQKFGADEQPLDVNDPAAVRNFQPTAKKETPTAASLAATANDPKQPPPMRAAAQAALEALQATPGQEETVRHNKAMEDIGRLTSGREAASQQETARHNKAMEDAARNAKSARPMLSSDAGKVADMDTSLTQLTGLRESVKSTGAVSQIEAGLPNFVTEFTGGIGEAAKSRNAQIALVRQIIGKTLEGGVLRKEDEIKYKAILPTIGDTPDVAAKKLDGLEALIKDKRSHLLEALGDAGFNVSALTSRGAQTGTIRARDPQGNIHEAAAGTALPAGWVLEK